MKASAVIKIILEHCDHKTLCFFTNGFISRMAFAIKDRASNFYMIGSMGLISSVGLGAALNSSNKVIIFDGDGSILMNMGVMPLIGYEKPENLVHLVFDNKVYASTGNQPSISRRVDFCRVAGSVGYKNISAFNQIRTFRKDFEKIIKARGLAFVHLDIEPESRLPPARVNINPEALTRRIREVLSKV
jgi:thiamine pyrophosphate-dependent acetolactate synthase large subunit-like protein